MTVLDLDGDIRAAARTHLLAMPAFATTGTLTNVSVSGSTYTRASGSFITNGFRAGDEIVASGFANATNNGRALIVNVTATTIVVDRALSSAAAGASVTIAAGLWQGQSWEGRAYAPVTGVPYISESLRAIWSQVRAIGRGGTIGHRLDLVLRLNYPAGIGTVGIERQAGAIRQHFEPGVQMTYGSHKATVLQVERTSLDHGTAWTTCLVSALLSAYTASQIS